MTQEEVRERQLVFPCNRNRNGAARPNGYMLAKGTGDFETTRRTMIRQMAYVTKYVTEDSTFRTTRKSFISQYGKDQRKTKKPLTR